MSLVGKRVQARAEANKRTNETDNARGLRSEIELQASKHQTRNNKHTSRRIESTTEAKAKAGRGGRRRKEDGRRPERKANSDKPRRGKHNTDKHKPNRNQKKQNTTEGSIQPLRATPCASLIDWRTPRTYPPLLPRGGRRPSSRLVSYGMTCDFCTLAIKFCGWRGPIDRLMTWIEFVGTLDAQGGPWHVCFGAAVGVDWAVSTTSIPQPTAPPSEQQRRPTHTHMRATWIDSILRWGCVDRPIEGFRPRPNTRGIDHGSAFTVQTHTGARMDAGEVEMLAASAAAAAAVNVEGTGPAGAAGHKKEEGEEQPAAAATVSAEERTARLVITALSCVAFLLLGALGGIIGKQRAWARARALFFMESVDCVGTGVVDWGRAPLVPIETDQTISLPIDRSIDGPPRHASLAHHPPPPPTHRPQRAGAGGGPRAAGDEAGEHLHLPRPGLPDRLLLHDIPGACWGPWGWVVFLVLGFYLVVSHFLTPPLHTSPKQTNKNRTGRSGSTC